MIAKRMWKMIVLGALCVASSALWMTDSFAAQRFPGPATQRRSPSMSTSPSTISVGPPDLVIDKFGVHGQQGLNVPRRLKVLVRNRGRGPVNSEFQLRVYREIPIEGGPVDPPYDVVVRMPIPSRRAIWVLTPSEINFCGTSPRTVRAEVDWADQIPESNESNNIKNEAVRPPCPDLLLADIRPKKVGRRWRVQLTIANRGGAASPPTRVDGLVTGSLNTWSFYLQVKPLEPNQSQTFLLDKPKRLRKKGWNVILWIDRPDRVMELLETNNFVSWEN